MAAHLKTLKREAKRMVTPEVFRQGGAEGIDSMTSNFDRDVELRPLVNIVKEAMSRFPKTKKGRSASDRWLAPRVHATLRLYRAEAARPELWQYLSLVVLRDYVNWRWANAEGLVDLSRLVGKLDRHALSRLWWIAELTRNGKDYRLTEAAFQLQTAVQFLLELDWSHNRAAALAFVRRLPGGDGGGPVTDRQVRILSDGLNFALSTTILDALAPGADPTSPQLDSWIELEPDETTMLDLLPEGPDELPVSEAHIEAVIDLLKRIPLPSAKDAPGDADDAGAGLGDESGEAAAAPGV